MSSGRVKKYQMKVLEDGRIETEKVNIFTKSYLTTLESTDKKFSVSFDRDGRVITKEASLDSPSENHLQLGNFKLLVDDEGRVSTEKI